MRWKKLFNGQWSDNLTNCPKLYKALAVMCQLTNEEKLSGMLMMLACNPFDFYAERVDGCDTYEDP